MNRQMLAVLLSLALTAVASAAAAGTIPRDVSLAPLVKEVSPAVVNISTRGTREMEQDPRLQDPFFRRFFGIPEQQERNFSSLGSGVIIDADEGLVLTNEHVVREADEITLSLEDGRQFKAEVVGVDADSDVAVLRIEDGKDLIDLPIGSSDALEVGDYVLAVGNPFGLGHSVTSGIVSAKGRSGLGIESYEDFIQTDASINRGNSGGALVNLQGELIGINTAILGPGGGSAGIGFAIPSRMARAVMEQILEFGEVRRGLLGVRGQELTPALAESLGLERNRGAVISEVIEDSAAEAAGLKEYDVIIEADGRPVADFLALRNVIGLKRPGDEVTLKVIRDGRERTINTRLGENQVAPVAEVRSNGLGGARLVAIPREHPLAGEVEGVMVESVEPGSIAQRQGLARGDIITSINRQEIDSLGAANGVIEDADRYLLKVRRGSQAFFVVIG